MDNVVDFKPARESLRDVASALAASINLAKCQVNCLAHALSEANTEGNAELQAQVENVLLAHVGFMEKLEDRFDAFESRLFAEGRFQDDGGAKHG